MRLLNVNRIIKHCHLFHIPNAYTFLYILLQIVNRMVYESATASTAAVLIMCVGITVSHVVSRHRKDVFKLEETGHVSEDHPVSNDNNNGGRRERSVSLFGRYVNTVMS